MSKSSQSQPSQSGATTLDAVGKSPDFPDIVDYEWGQSEGRILYQCVLYMVMSTFSVIEPTPASTRRKCISWAPWSPEPVPEVASYARIGKQGR
ncbi:hypothetical protein CC1G_04832 [Coprinopsis cinerea okayama7|uniref:Uncharacterized protein n=1 Tax=Coprinopsis cinerea (strain Okayama-7 / 130 / ATCC MYA-4618 / FGSC 9003) TaxID=240176 RepID=A8PFQ9_COPC7|nr:hypothetical protein CC1G_04832 [Coprinopsis cinerea okayama7\|eukprot:XP_001840988.2 hypothetical protein CC1G_04832 [Coprinopsis cinerea okayama7\